MKAPMMDDGPAYALHDDAAPRRSSASGNGGAGVQSPLIQRHVAATRSSSSYEPPNAPGAKAVTMPMATTRIMDRDPVYDRSKGRWK
jgi:hypothetical protein